MGLVTVTDENQQVTLQMKVELRLERLDPEEQLAYKRCYVHQILKFVAKRDPLEYARALAPALLTAFCATFADESDSNAFLNSNICLSVTPFAIFRPSIHVRRWRELVIALLYWSGLGEASRDQNLSLEGWAVLNIPLG